MREPTAPENAHDPFICTDLLMTLMYNSLTRIYCALVLASLQNSQSFKAKAGNVTVFPLCDELAIKP